MNGPLRSLRVAVALACLLGSLGLVTWRQTRAFEALAALEEVRRARQLADAELADLVRRIQHLESRGRVVPAARAGLDMHTPDASEMVFLAGGAS